MVHWLARRDPDLAALRRAGRTAIVMPAMFAVGDRVIGNPTIATFAAFGSFAMLLLVDFRGPMRVRLQDQAALALVGGGLVCLGTLASGHAWVAAVVMALVALAVLFAGVVSSVLTAAGTSLLLAFILPVSLAEPVSSVPDRLAGWGMASGAAMIAIAVLWPTPQRDPLRGPVIEACRALADRLRADVAYLLGREPTVTEPHHEEAVAGAHTAVEALRRAFFATPYRPTGLSTGARALVRLVDELFWLDAIITHSGITHSRITHSGITHSGPRRLGNPPNVASCQVKLRAASVLDRGAELLSAPVSRPEALGDALAELRRALAEVEQTATIELARVPGAHVPPGARGELAGGEEVKELVSALDPSFRAQELSFVVRQMAANIALASAAEQRNWLERLLGRQPTGLPNTLSAARQRAGSHFERHSVWLHNSLRGAVGLGLAVLVARLSGVQHSFWVVLGTLSVLRSNALNTGQNVVRGLIGTVVGFVTGAGILAVIGTNTTLLWLLLPIVILLAGIAPAVISFAAGQAAFTLVLVILFNIVQPTGWRVGLLRVEDIAIGCAVSLLVGVLFWPRGAAGALGQALTEAYDDGAGYLARAVAYGVGRGNGGEPGPPLPTDEAARSAAAARRLDDAFRSYLAERGAKPVPLAEVTGLVTGVVALRLAGDAVLDLWRRDEGDADGDRSVAGGELLATTETVVDWYKDLATSLTGRSPVPDPLVRDDPADQRLIDAVRHDLRGRDGSTSATGVRMIWTGDHLDAARRLQATLVGPARAATATGALTPVGAALGLAAMSVRACRRTPAGGRDPIGVQNSAETDHRRQTEGQGVDGERQQGAGLEVADQKEHGEQRGHHRRPGCRRPPGAGCRSRAHRGGPGPSVPQRRK